MIPSPSPSVKIQIIGGKVCFRCKGKTLLGVVDKLLKTKEQTEKFVFQNEAYRATVYRTGGITREEINCFDKMF